MSLVGKAVEAVTLIALALLVPRALGAVGYGRFAAALALVQLASAALSLGGPSVMARYVPVAPAARRPAVARAIAVRLARWRVAAVVGIALVAAALARAVPDDVAAGVALVVVAAIALDSGATLVTQAGLGLGRTTLWSFRWPLENGVLVAAALGLTALWGAEAALGALPIAAGVAALVAAALVVPTLRAADRGASVPTGALRFGAISAASGLIGLLMTRGAILAVALLAGSTVETGYAGLAVGAALALWYAVSQAFTAGMPALAERAEHDRPAAEQQARRLARAATLALLPVAIAIAATAESIVLMAFGEEFRGAVPAFAVAFAMVPLAPAAALSAQAASLRLRPGIRLRASLVGGAVFLAGALALVPRWEALGACLALLGGMTASTLVVAVMLRDVLSRRLVLVALGGALATLLVGIPAW